MELKKPQTRMEVRQITEYRDGAIWKTKSLYEAWVDVGEKVTPPKDQLLCALSTTRSKELGYKGTFRLVTSDVPFIVRIEANKGEV